MIAKEQMFKVYANYDFFRGVLVNVAHPPAPPQKIRPWPSRDFGFLLQQQMTDRWKVPLRRRLRVSINITREIMENVYFLFSIDPKPVSVNKIFTNEVPDHDSSR